MEAKVTVLIPHIGNRGHLLPRAVQSVRDQTVPCELLVQEDTLHEGASATRNRGLPLVGTEWVAFLDDDDWLLPHHVETCLKAQAETDADVVYPWYEVKGGGDPKPDAFGQPFDPDRLRRESYIFVGCLARTSLAQQAGFHAVGTGRSQYSDAGFYRAMLDLGAVFHHVPERTYMWSHWGWGKPGKPGNTSGQGSNW